MARIRICQLITTLEPGGAESCVFELATRLDRDRFDVQVVGLRGGALVDKLRAAGVTVQTLGIRRKWSVGNPVKLRRLTALLKRERIDLLHTHMFHADLAGRLAARRAGLRRVVHTVHVAEKRFRPWHFSFARWGRRHCDRIVCVSKSVHQWHAAKSRLPADVYEVIPNGIDVAAFARDDSARQTLRKQWGAGPDDVVAAFVGRLDKQKGVDTLLDAAARLAGNTQDGRACNSVARGKTESDVPRASKLHALRIILAGDGPLRPSVEAFCASEAGAACRYLGFVPNIRDVLSAADLFVLPSRWEGWPLALGEAMAAGLPAVGADSPGIRDVLVPGQTGLLVAPEDPVALAGAILMLAGDAPLRTKFAAAAQQRIRDHFTIQKFVAAHEQLYGSLTAQ